MYDLVVLGGGSGGLNIASAAARVGAKVALVEKGKLGGECTHSACVPSKALLQAARVAHAARSAAEFGVRVGPVEVDFPAVMRRVHAVVADFYGHDKEDRLRAKGIDVVFGTPRFEAYDAVVVDGTTRIEGARFVIATGSRPAVPEIPGLIETGYLDNQTVWDLQERPESLAILGAGPVGLELGQAFARLGVEVTLFDGNAEILHHEDPEAARLLRERLEAEGLTFHLGAEVIGIGTRGGKTLLKFRSVKDGLAHEAACTHLLVATGRAANIDGLNLEAVGIHATSASGIPVDEYLATPSPHIYALGDVIGKDRYTHAAEREAAIVLQNAVLKLPKKYRGDAMPRTTFTDPEFAAVGKTEAEARAEHPEVRVFHLDLAKVDRVRIDGEPGGLARVFVTESGRVLGATIAGPNAAMAIQEFVLAIEHGLTLADLAATIHPYPTMASAVRSLANQYSATRLEKGFVRTALKWFYGFTPSASERPA